jgi:hypothetical protein
VKVELGDLIQHDHHKNEADPAAGAQRAHWLFAEIVI